MIRRAVENDLDAIAAINRASFSGNKPPGAAEQWVRSNFARFPQYQYFVSEEEGAVIAYIGWEVRNGFNRTVPVLELEQLAVHEEHRGRGVGSTLVLESFAAMKNWVKENRPDATTLRVAVWTDKKNAAAGNAYKKICNQGEWGERNMLSEIEKGRHEVMLRGEYAL